jgi:Protein of unknown function (DUF2975)
MNANEIPPKAGTRLGRIKKASRILRLSVGACLVLGMPYTLAQYLGWLPLSRGRKILISPHQLYASASEIPKVVLSLGLVRLGLLVFCLLVLYKLFRLYELGILFSARNVRYIRFFGYFLIIDWLVLYQLEALAPPIELSCDQFFNGLLIIFVGWIMDEGRKIQEEQELTV